MGRRKLSLLQTQLRIASRRLFLGTLFEYLIWFWTAALGLAIVWFLVEYPFVFEKQPVWWQRWAVAGGLIALSSLAAFVAAWWRSPSLVSTALELDGRFKLKERVTTSLLLSEEEKQSPAGQALLADVEQHITKLDVRSQFGVPVSRKSAIVPLGLAMLAAVAVFYHPTRGRALTKEDEKKSEAVTNTKEIEKKVAQLKKPPLEPKTDKPKSEKLQELENELDKIAKKPADTKEHVRDRIKELTEQQQNAKDLQQKLSEKDRMFKSQLRQLEKLEKRKDGPADQFRKDLEKGDLKEAKEELEKLRERLGEKEIDEKKLTEGEKQKLKEQLDDLQKQIKELAQNQKKQDELKKLFEQGKIDKQTFDKAMEDLKKEAAEKKDLQKLADALKQAKEALDKGDPNEVMEALQKAAEQLEQMEGAGKELKELRDKLQEMAEAQDAMAKALDDSEQSAQGPPGDQFNNQPMPDAGKRPEADSPNMSSIDQKEKAAFDPKGQVIHQGYAPGQNFRKKPTAEVESDIRQAAQDAPEAIERQKIPRDARNITRGYFKNLGGQK